MCFKINNPWISMPLISFFNLIFYYVQLVTNSTTWNPFGLVNSCEKKLNSHGINYRACLDY